MSTKITLLVENCWIIRSIRLDKDGNPSAPQFFEASNIWNKSPAHATIFRSEESAFNNLCNHDKLMPRMTNEILEAVPMHGALLAHGHKVQKRKPKS